MFPTPASPLCNQMLQKMWFRRRLMGKDVRKRRSKSKMEMFKFLIGGIFIITYLQEESNSITIVLGSGAYSILDKFRELNQLHP